MFRRRRTRSLHKRKNRHRRLRANTPWLNLLSESGKQTTSQSSTWRAKLRMAEGLLRFVEGRTIAESTGLLTLPRTGADFARLVPVMVFLLKALKAIRRR